MNDFEIEQIDIFAAGSCRIREDLIAEARAGGFDGESFSLAKDGIRLTGQLARVWDLMADGEWRTLEEIAARAGGSEGGVAARLRDLRKPRFGGFRVDRERVKDSGLYRYRVAQ
jgi:hypothetical protein